MAVVATPSRRIDPLPADRVRLRASARKSTSVVWFSVPRVAVTVAVPAVVPEVRVTVATPLALVVAADGMVPRDEANWRLRPVTPALVVVSLTSSEIFEVLLPLATMADGADVITRVTPRRGTSRVSLCPSAVAMMVAVPSAVAASASRSTEAVPLTPVCCGCKVESEPTPLSEKVTTRPERAFPSPSTTLAVTAVSS